MSSQENNHQNDNQLLIDFIKDTYTIESNKHFFVLIPYLYYQPSRIKYNIICIKRSPRFQIVPILLGKATLPLKFHTLLTVELLFLLEFLQWI